MPSIPAEERFQIQDVSYAYNFYCDTEQFAQCPELFTDDAVFDETCLGLPAANGKEEIRRVFASTAPGAVAYFVHYTTSIWVREYDGTTASAICYLRAEGSFTNGAHPLVLGYYDDTYEKVDGRWLIRSRTLVPFAPPSGWTFPSHDAG